MYLYHTLPPRNAYDDGGFFDFAGKLEHSAGAGSRSEGHELDGAYHKEQEIRAIQPGEALGVREGEINRAKAHGGYQIGEEREIGNEGGKLAAALGGPGPPALR